VFKKTNRKGWDSYSMSGDVLAVRGIFVFAVAMNKSIIL